MRSKRDYSIVGLIGYFAGLFLMALGCVLLLCVSYAAVVGLAVSHAAQSPPPAAKTEIVGDDKLSLEWINLTLQVRLADETIARLQRERADTAKQANDKLIDIRKKANVPESYVGEVRENKLVFTPPKPTSNPPNSER